MLLLVWLPCVEMKENTVLPLSGTGKRLFKGGPKPQCLLEYWEGTQRVGRVLETAANVNIIAIIITKLMHCQ